MKKMTSNEYIDRSLTSVEEWKKTGDEIFALKRQTIFGIQEATAKNLLKQARLRASLKDLESNGMEAIQAKKALRHLQRNWEELNELYEEVTWRPPLPWDDGYELMRQLLLLVEKVKGQK